MPDVGASVLVPLFREAVLPVEGAYVPSARPDRIGRFRPLRSVRSSGVWRAESVHAGYRRDAESELGRDAHLQRSRHLRVDGVHQGIPANHRRRNIRSRSCRELIHRSF